MATISFSIRGTTEEKTIYLRLVDSTRIDLKQSTKIKIDEKYWNSKKGEVKPLANFDEKESINEKLRMLTKNVSDAFAQVHDISVIDANWLKSAMSEIEKKPTQSRTKLVELILLKISNLRKSNVHPGTIRNYETTISRIQRFQSHINRTMYTDELSLDFHAKYFDFCQNELCLNVNSIGRDFKNIKASCSVGHDFDIQIHKNVSSSNFKNPSENTDFVTLNINEIQQLKTFSGPSYLENARDWLIIGCWTGCRVKDLMSLNLDNLVDVDGFEFLKYTQSKTGKTVSVRLHDDVREILKKRNGFPKAISDVKFNSFIKDVCKRLEFNELLPGSIRPSGMLTRVKGLYPKWQLVTSHVCRRSFATIHYKFLSNKQIMQVTGHSTESMLLKYIGEIEYSDSNAFGKAWEQIESVIN